MRLTRFRLLAATLAAAVLAPSLYAGDLPAGAADRAPRLAAAPKAQGAPKLSTWTEKTAAPRLKSAAEPASYATPNAATVTVSAPQNARESYSGTGTVVWSEGGKSLAVTNRHVVKYKRSDDGLTVTMRETGRTYPARFVAWSDDGDAAIVEFDAAVTPAAIGTDPAPGTRTTHYGNTTGPQTGTVKGYESTGTTGDGWAGRYLRGTHHGDSGDSGAGLFNDRGELVGVVWGGHSGNAGCAPVSVVRGLLRRCAGRAFPRLAARLAGDESAAPEYVEAAPAAPQLVPAGSTKAAGDCPAGSCPAGVCQPQTAAAVSYRVGNGPLLTPEQFRQQYPQLAGVASGGVVTGSVVTGTVQAGGSCANGVCYPATPSRRGIFR